MPRLVVVLLAALAALNVVDIIIHVAVDQVEPLRVSSNMLVIVAAVTMLVARRVRTVPFVVLVAVVYLALNLVFVALFSIGALGALLVGATTLLLLLLAAGLKR